MSMRAVLTALETDDAEAALALAMEMRRAGDRPLLLLPSACEEAARAINVEFLSLESETTENGTTDSSLPASCRLLIKCCRDADVLIGPSTRLACRVVRRILPVSFVALRVSDHGRPPGGRTDRELETFIVRQYRKLRGEPPVDGAKDGSGNSWDLTIHAVSDHVRPAPAQSPDGKVTGFFFMEDREWRPGPDLAGFCDGEAPIVMVLGSPAQPASESMTNLALEAARRTKLKTVIQYPWKGLPGDSVPENVRLAGFIPSQWLYRHAALIVHHGGAAATAGALLAGIPSVIIPQNPSQQAWAEIAKAKGCAGDVIPSSQIGAEQLAAAIRSALATTELRQAAALMGERIRAEEGVQSALGLVRELIARRESPSREGPRRPPHEMQGAAARWRGDLPLSYAQQRLWFLARMDPESLAYNMPFGLRMKGALDVEALRQALQGLVRRHEVLRTSFPARGGQPVQEIAPRLNLEMEQIDLRDWGSAPEREAEAQRRALAEIRPFDVGRAPLLRTKLLQLADYEHVLLVDMHHIVTDGWSAAILVRELGHLYAGYAQGAEIGAATEAGLPPLPVQYADYSVWQREWLQGAVLEEQLQYWREQLSGLRVLDLPTDWSRPAQISHEGAHLNLRLGWKVTNGLREVTQKAGSTLYMGLLSAWQILLCRYSGQPDIAVGSPIAGRTRPEIDGLVGFFVNTLVLRTKISMEESFTDMLGRVRETTLEAYRHQDVPFEKLVEVLQPQRDLSQTPLFQVMLGLQNMQRSDLELAGIKLKEFEFGMHEPAAKFDLTLTLTETSEGLAGGLEYRSALFAREMMEALLRQLQTLLEAIVENPQRRVREFPSLNRSEREELIWGWSGGELSEPITILAGLQSETELRPTEIAVIGAQGEELSYAELERRSQSVARRLRAAEKNQGGNPLRVGLWLEGGVELVTGAIGILKAGGVLVPLESAEQIPEMVRDAELALVLTQRKLADRRPADAGDVAFVLLEECIDSPEGQAEHNNKDRYGDGPGCVLYRSDGEGHTRGVLLPRSALGYARWDAPLDVGPGDRQAQSMNLARETNCLQIFQALASGACLVELPSRPPLPPRKLARLLTDRRVTVLFSAASSLERVAGEFPEAFDNIRRIVCEGDEETVQAVAENLRTSSGKEWERLYGMRGWSESGGPGMFYSASGAGPVMVESGQIALGVTLHLLDPAMEPTPAGAMGEIYVESAAPAWGYAGHPDATAESFVPHPFSPTPGARLYRTGDWGRRHPNDLLELRRKQTPAAAAESAAPAAIPYVAPRNTLEEQMAGIWQQVLGDGPPVGINDNFFARGGHSLLATQAVARMSDALGVDVSLRHLFEAPTLAQLSPLLEKLLSHPSGVQPEIQSDTPAAPKAHRIRKVTPAPDAQAALPARKKVVPAAAPPIRKAERRRILPLSYGQQRLWFLARMEPEGLAYNMPFGLRMKGSLDVEALRQGLEGLVRRHEILRTSFPSRAGRPVQEIAPRLDLEMEQMDLRSFGDIAEREAEARRRALAAIRPFDVGRGPLLRALLLQLADYEHALLLDMHHIVSDGWSTAILVRELGHLYAGYSQGAAVGAAAEAELPPLPVQYADYAVWQREWLQGAVLEDQVGYWREQLEGLKTLDLPADFDRPDQLSHQGGHLGMVVGSKVTSGLKELAQKAGGTLYMGLLVAWQVLLCRYSGQNDIAVGSPIAGRTRPELDGLVGFFVNTLVLRTKVAMEESFVAMLARVREMTLEAYRHQDVPFEKLVEVLHPQRDLSQTPLFQVMLGLQNVQQASLDLAGVQLREFDFGMQGTAAKFDITLTLTETGAGMAGGMEYRSALFARESMEGLLRQMQTLLEAIVENPECQVGELPLLSKSEREELIWGWSGGDEESSAERNILSELRTIAGKRPAAIALIDAQGEELSYAELERRGKAIARKVRAALKTRDGDEPRIGLWTEGGIDLLTGALGIIKAGGALVPLEVAEQAAERQLPTMAKDAELSLILTRQPLRDRWPADSGGNVAFVLMEECIDSPDDSSGNKNDCEFEAALGCVLYRSPGGGKAQGVLLPQRALGFARWEAPLDLGPDDRQALTMTLAREANCQQIFQALAAGACLVELPSRPPLPPRKLARLLTDRKVTVLFSASSSLERVAGEFPKAFDRIRRVVCEGEIETVRAVAEKLRTSTGKEWERLYGMRGWTESGGPGVFYSASTKGPVMVDSAQIASGVTLHLLDRAMEPTPAGAMGEILIESAALGRGYANRADTTAESFVPHPFSPTPGARLYRTGDLGRRHPNGMLELRRKRTPETADEAAGAAAVVPYVAPRTPLEEQMARIWEQVLGDGPPVGINDNFFARGGHSLLATQAVARMSDALGVDVSLRRLFELPTLARLSPWLEQLLARPGARPDAQTDTQSLVAIQPKGSRAPFFCVHPVGGQVICYAELSRELGLDQPFYGMQSPADDSISTIEQMAIRYNQELRRVRPHGPYSLGGWSMGGLIAWEMARQLTREGEAIALLALFDAHSSVANKPASNGAHDLLYKFVGDIHLLAGRDFGSFSEKYSRLDAPAQWELVLETLKREGLLKRDNAAGDLTQMVNIFTRNTMAVDNYVMQKSGQPIVLIRASDSVAQLPGAGLWTQWAGKIDLHVVPGNHYTILRQPAVLTIAEILKSYFERAHRRESEIKTVEA